MPTFRHAFWIRTTSRLLPRAPALVKASYHRFASILLSARNAMQIVRLASGSGLPTEDEDAALPGGEFFFVGGDTGLAPAAGIAAGVDERRRNEVPMRLSPSLSACSRPD